MSATNPNIPQNQVKNRQLERTVEELLARESAVHAQDINIRAHNGQIVLTGAVGSLLEKDIAGNLAKRAEGVKFVENDLVISVDEPLGDGDIRERLEEAFGNFPEYDPPSVGVRLVEDGVIYLTGSVISGSEKTEAEKIASGIKGVRQVINEIVIAPGEPLNDVDIHNLVMDAISNDPRIDPFDIEVEVKDGDVSVTGSVRDRQARDAVSERILETPGVKAVFNGLEIREKR